MRWALVLILLAASPCRAETSLFDDLGGRKKISAFTEDLADRIRQDPRIAHFFDETDMDRFRDRLTDMFCHVTGEKRPYRGANMYRAHEGLGITDAAFNAVVEDLEEAMDDYQVPWSAQARFLGVLAPLKREIVAK